MDDISSSNLHSISVCDLNTKFNDRCFSDWSDSNLISLVTLDGIYILKPQLDEKGPFQIELIRNPSDRFSHPVIDDRFTKFDTIWHTLNSHQYMEVFLNPALLTNVETLSMDLYPRRYRLAKWSPVVETFPRHCLLATITVDYQLEIFNRRDNTWLSCADLSRNYNKLWNQLNPTKDLSKKDDFDTIRDNLHSLSFCNVCWKDSKVHGPTLLSATIPGDIVIWNIPTQTKGSPGVLIEHQPEVKIILQTNLEYISSMRLFESLLIVSTRDGQVNLYDLTSNFKDYDSVLQTQQTNGLPVIKTLSLIELPPTATLWHRDSIEVTDFYIQQISQDAFRIVLAKSTNICWCIINYQKGTEETPATLAISDSFSAIDGLDPDVSLHQTPATWLRPACNRKAVLIAEDGSFFQLEFVDDRQDTSPEFTAIRTGRVDLARLVPRGLCTSPNGNLITMISCISLVYDPAKITAPAKLILVPTINEKKFLVECIQKLTDENWLASESIDSPMGVQDRIDYLRSTFSLLTREHLFNMHKSFEKSIAEIGMPKNVTQLVKLKIAAFLIMKLTDHTNRNMIDGDQRLSFDKKVHEIIHLYNTKTFLSIVLGGPMGNDGAVNEKLSTDQVNSLRNYFNWLDKCPDGKQIRDQYIGRYEVLETEYAETPNETCTLCNAEIPFVSVEYGTCNNRHRFDRCARSLLVMNLPSTDELVCEHCRRRYRTNMIWPDDNLWLCSYCQ